MADRFYSQADEAWIEWWTNRKKERESADQSLITNARYRNLLKWQFGAEMVSIALCVTVKSA
jgi:hypothetical protein